MHNTYTYICIYVYIYICRTGEEGETQIFSTFRDSIFQFDYLYKFSYLTPNNFSW